MLVIGPNQYVTFQVLSQRERIVSVLVMIALTMALFALFWWYVEELNKQTKQRERRTKRERRHRHRRITDKGGQPTVADVGNVEQCDQ